MFTLCLDLCDLSSDIPGVLNKFTCGQEDLAYLVLPGNFRLYHEE